VTIPVGSNSQKNILGSSEVAWNRSRHVWLWYYTITLAVWLLFLVLVFLIHNKPWLVLVRRTGTFDSVLPTVSLAFLIHNKQLLRGLQFSVSAWITFVWWVGVWFGCGGSLIDTWVGTWGKVWYQGWYVDLIIKINPFRLVLGSITDRDNQGEETVSSGSDYHQRSW
jgi:hypothetical protein